MKKIVLMLAVAAFSTGAMAQTGKPAAATQTAKPATAAPAPAAKPTDAAKPATAAPAAKPAGQSKGHKKVAKAAKPAETK